MFCSVSLRLPHCWHWCSYNGIDGGSEGLARARGLGAQPKLHHARAFGNAAADQVQHVEGVDDAGVLGRREGPARADVVEGALAVDEAEQLELGLLHRHLDEVL